MGTDKGKYIKVDGGPVVYPISTCPLVETPQSIVYMLTLPVEMLRDGGPLRRGCVRGVKGERRDEGNGWWLHKRAIFWQRPFPRAKAIGGGERTGKSIHWISRLRLQVRVREGCEEEEDATWKTHGR